MIDFTPGLLLDESIVFITNSVYPVYMASLNLQSQCAYDFIRKKILSGEYPPKFFISGKGLAGEVGVSRTPIRDALRLLEKEGLVELTPGYGAQVRSLTSQEFEDMWQTRVALEGMAAMLAAERRTDEDLALLEVNMKHLRAEGEGLDPATWTEAEHARFAARDRAFHQLILAASKNTILSEEVNRLHLIQTTIADPLGDARRKVKAPRLTCQEHKRIIEAIRNRESAAAREFVEKHLAYSPEAVV